MNAPKVDVLAVMDGACAILSAANTRVAESELRLARAAVAELIEAAKDCNEWLCRTDREGTAHQRNLAAALANIGPQS